MWYRCRLLSDIFPGLVLPRLFEAVEEIFKDAISSDWKDYFEETCNYSSDECDLQLKVLTGTGNPIDVDAVKAGRLDEEVSFFVLLISIHIFFFTS